jgi:hypothetical protein
MASHLISRSQLLDHGSPFYSVAEHAMDERTTTQASSSDEDEEPLPQNETTSSDASNPLVCTLLHETLWISAQSERTLHIAGCTT